MAKKKKPSLSSEDKKLWKRVTDTVMPREGKSSPASDESFMQAMENVSRIEKRDYRPVLNTPFAPPPRVGVTKPAEVKRRALLTNPALLHFEKKEKSRISRGITHIDGRIDLHGMNQNQAYNALHSFIGRAFASDWKNILVITGKGNSTNYSRQPQFSDMSEQSYGILRQKVPQWLSDKSMRKFIISFDTAGLNHGGSGALYVRLRRKNRSS